MTTLLRDDQVKYIDVEGMRAFTNNRCVAEQMKGGKVENVAMGGVKIVECGNVGQKTKFKEHRDEWSQNSKSWKIGEFQS